MVTVWRASECFLSSTERFSWPFQCSHRTIMRYSLLVKPEFRAFSVCPNTDVCKLMVTHWCKQDSPNEGVIPQMRAYRGKLCTNASQNVCLPGCIRAWQSVSSAVLMEFINMSVQKQSKPHSWARIWNGLYISGEELFYSRGIGTICAWTKLC